LFSRPVGGPAATSDTDREKETEMSVHVRIGKSKRAETRLRGACVHVRSGGAVDGTDSVGFWLTPAEADELAELLVAAARRARAMTPNYPAPEPPVANAAALSEAA
jgi:hypothetical protein